MSETINSMGSVFLNHKTQSIRLKREIRFPTGVKKVSLFQKKFEDGQAIYIIPTENKEDFISYCLQEEGISLKSHESIVPALFDDSSHSSLFLNNKTQSVRIPMNIRFPEDVKAVLIESHTFSNGLRYLVASHRDS